MRLILALACIAISILLLARLWRGARASGVAFHDASMPQQRPIDETAEDEIDLDNCPEFNAGDYVQIIGNPSGITLAAHTGYVTRPDPEWEGYYLVKLDAPARDWDTGELVSEIVEAAFNLTLIRAAPAPHQPATTSA